MKCDSTDWMRCAFANAGRGLFHRQLGVPKGTKIPMGLLRAIVRTTNGKRVRNPTTIGDRIVLVTPLIKKRATALLNADVIRNRKAL